MKPDKIRGKITSLIAQYFESKLEKFIPGKTLIRYAGSVYDSKEISAMVDSLMSGWLGLGSEGEKFEKELAKFVGTKFCLMTNSGSSANLLAISALGSQRLINRLKDGDEVIVTAAAFPSTISPIVQNRLVPVFIDVNSQSYNLNPSDLEEAFSKKTRLLVICHNFGNPNDMDKVMEFAKSHKLFVIEDNCDALGSKFAGKYTGSFGDLSTQSFYPAHHITTGGEGGAVLIKDNFLYFRIVGSLRDWGRACWCGASGGPKNGLCHARFRYKIDGFPYDHKYIFDHIGYNLKPTEAQAAMGRVQLQRLPEFVAARKKNFKAYNDFFQKYKKFFTLPKSLPKADPCWFAYLLTIRDDAPFDRLKLTQYLEDHNIQTRPSFSGNILRQPGYRSIVHRKIGSLNNSDRIFEQAFFIGIYPGLTSKHTDYVKTVFSKFLRRY